MKILCIDVGTGTQDILLFDSDEEIENCVQMVMPSPTQIVARQIRAATQARHTLLLDGVTMGGGPGAWAAEEHMKAGLLVYATPLAAQTFDDDLERVAAMGVKVVQPDELSGLAADLGPDQTALVHMRDLYVEEIEAALSAFGVPAEYDALAVAAFDHGAAPPGYSDRRFRFEYLTYRMEQWGTEPVGRALSSFAAPANKVPEQLTRLHAVSQTLEQMGRGHVRTLLMDTGAAALLGALGDPVVAGAATGDCLFVNAGNFHTLAFHIRRKRVVSLFEHHTGLLSGAKLVGLLGRLSRGTLANEDVFDDSGHGALYVSHGVTRPSNVELCLVTGPRRGMLGDAGAPWPVYMAVPHGDMMLAGCFGLLRAFAEHFPEDAQEILPRLEPR